MRLIIGLKTPPLFKTKFASLLNIFLGINPTIPFPVATYNFSKYRSDLKRIETA
jgi:hypothetical protein